MLRDMDTLRRLLIALAGPLVVVLALVVMHSAPLVFLLYHVGFCLALPLAVSVRAGLTPVEHARRLGLVRRGLGTGLALGLAFAVPPAVAFTLMPTLFPDAAALRAALLAWRLDPAAPAGFLFFLALLNGPAEELFWRGWVLRDPMPGPAARVVLAALFTSYHAVTIGRLAPDPRAAAAMLAAVFAGALLWTWMRARWQSVWPALLAHTGATCGYLFVCAKLLVAG